MRQSLDKISTKVLRFIPFLLAIVTPLFFLPVTVDYFTFNKYYFIAIVGTISLIAWCIRNLTRGKLHFTISPALLPLVILVIANIVSSIWLSPTKHVSLFGQTSLFFFLAIIFLTVTSSQKNRFTVVSAIYGLIASASLLSLFTLLHYFGILGKVFSSDLLTNRFLNPTGNVLSAISFTIPILVATTIFTTGIKNWTLKSALFASVLLMIVGSIINISFMLPQNGQPVFFLLPMRAGWSIAVDTMKTWQTALFGTGPETFFSAFTRLRPAYLNLDENIWSMRFSESSSFFLTLVTTTGIVGALAFVFSFIRPFLTSFRTRKNIEEKTIQSFITTSLAIVILTFFVVPTGIVSLTTAIILIICLTILQKLENQKMVKDVNISLSADSPDSPIYTDLPENFGSRNTVSFLPWFVVFISVAILSSFWFFASKMYFASVSYKQATELVESNPYESYLKYQKAAQLDVYNPYYPQRLSQVFLTISNAYLTKTDATDDDKKSGTDFAQRAIDAGKISARLDPLNVSTWENLYTVYRNLIPYAQGSVDMAVSHGLQAASVDPTNPAIYLQLGSLFYNLGDADQAIKFIDRSVGLKQNWNLPYLSLSSIYKAQKQYARALQYAQLGLQYTDQKSEEDLTTIREEIKSLEKLAPATPATQSAVPQ